VPADPQVKPNVQHHGTQCSVTLISTAHTEFDSSPGEARRDAVMDFLHRYYLEDQGRPRWKFPAKQIARHPGLLLYIFREQFRWLRVILRTVAKNRHQHKTVALARQLWQSLAFARKYQVNPKSYYDYRVYADWRRRHRYIFDDEIVVLLHRLNARVCPDDFADLTDKRRFFRRCKEAGLPVIPILSEFENGKVSKTSTDRGLYERDLFSKFSNRYCGEGVNLWRFKDGAYDHDDGVYNLEQLHEYLARRSTEYPNILQPYFSNHNSLLPIAGKALSTVRAITIRRPNGTPEVGLACLRMATGETIADNFAMGSIAAPISLSTGRLGPALPKEPHNQKEEIFTKHPNTGSMIEGVGLPYWPEAMELAIRAHSVFFSMPSVGWDIAITNNGPILVEGNGVWGVDVVQISHQQPIGDTAIPDCIYEHFQLLEKR
jgi:Sugar-transfer associated ATP-grasp